MILPGQERLNPDDGTAAKRLAHCPGQGICLLIIQSDRLAGSGQWCVRCWLLVWGASRWHFGLAFCPQANWLLGLHGGRCGRLHVCFKTTLLAERIGSAAMVTITSSQQARRVVRGATASSDTPRGRVGQRLRGSGVYAASP